MGSGLAGTSTIGLTASPLSEMCSESVSSLRPSLPRPTAPDGTSADAMPVVHQRPFRFGTGSWNSFFQYETVPRRANGDSNSPSPLDYSKIIVRVKRMPIIHIRKANEIKQFRRFSNDVTLL
eukprot:SAG22_NODE_2727_length_2276_cov_1.092329_1_plen_122_part_00